MREIYDFLNSKDIREHLRDLEYEFSLPEAAYIIQESRQVSLEEKLEALAELRDIYPDCSMEGRGSMPEIKSFHEFLGRYIDIQNRIIAAFEKPDDGIYRYTLLERGFDYRELHPSNIFLTLDECLSMCRMCSCDAVEVFEIGKELITQGETYCTFRAFYSPDFELMSLDSICFLNEDDCAIFQAFEWMWFAFPTPFRRGDILLSRFNYLSSETFVLDHMLTWDENQLMENGFLPEEHIVKDRARILKYKHEDGDYSDMCAGAYFLDEAGLRWGHAGTYLDFERYEGELDGDKRLLAVVSHELKKLPARSIDIPFLINASHMIIKEHREEALKKRMNNMYVRSQYTDELIKKIGITPEEAPEG